MKKSWLFLLLLVHGWLLSPVMAGNENQPAGARLVSLGNAYTGVRGDFWSLYANPAGIAGIQQMEAGAFAERRFLLNQLNFGAVGFVMPFKDRHYAGFDVSGMGFASYSETKIGLTYATVIFERLSLGAKLNYTRTSIQNYGSAGAVFLNLGINAAISDDLSVGFRVFNANRAEINQEIGERIPTTLDLGVAYQVSDKLLLVGDLEKQVNYPLSFRGGIEYAIIDKLIARVGASTEPVTFSAGLGLHMDAFDLDFANTFHEYLGYTPSLSFNYRFGQAK